jgi:hypothetical protein
MKKIFILISLLVSMTCHAQDSSNITLSKYEKFVSASGKLIKIVTLDVDKVASAKITVATATDIQAGTHYQSVNLLQVKGGFLIPGNIGSITIDMDELPDFINALKYIQGQVEGKKPSNETSFIYSTTNGVIISSTYYTSGFMMKGWNVSFSQVYKYSRVPISTSTIVLKNKEITDMEDALRKASNLGK